MIRIDKPSPPPTVLTGRGAERSDAHRRSYDDGPEPYRSGDRTFSFTSGIYGHVTVKDALIAAQHGKCCFCERLTFNDGDVEHYRPKGSTKQGPGEPYLRPGYYWLAYDWDNLFLACSPCNSRQKQSLFPLSDPAARARSHHDDLAAEAPLFVKPDGDDPEAHIGFRAEVPYPKTERGRVTVEALDLGRDVLCEDRLQRLHELQTMHELVGLAAKRPGDAELQRLAGRAERRIAEAVSDAGEFASANRCAVADGFALVIPPSPSSG